MFRVGAIGQVEHVKCVTQGITIHRPYLLDKGYIRCKKFVIDKLIQPYFDLDVVIQTNTNHKSKIIEWTQRQNKTVRFELMDVKKSRNQKEFAIQVFIDDKEYATGFGFTKKKAEQDAALKTCTQLNIV